MPFALIIAGIIFTVAGVRSTENALFSLLKNDFTGTPSFVYWALSILIIGSVGYLPGMRQLANAFMALILIVLLLKVNEGKSGPTSVFSEFLDAFKNIPPAPIQSNGLVSGVKGAVSGAFQAVQDLPIGGGVTLGGFNELTKAMSNVPGL